LKPHSAKSKGRKFQQWVRDLLLRGADSLTLDDVRSASMGAGGSDILMSTAAKAIYPWSVECKSQERVNIWKAYAQAEANKDHEDDEPIVFISRNRQKPLVLMDAEFFVTERYKEEE